MKEKKIVLTVDVEPDVNLKGVFGTPLSYKGVDVGMNRLKSLIEDLPVTFFVSGRCLDKVGDLVDTFNCEIGALFNVGDYNPKKERIEGTTYSMNSFDATRKTLSASLSNCVDEFKRVDVDLRSIRFGGASVNIDVLKWLGEQDVFTHSSSTAPGMISSDKKIDHRLYKHDPYKVGNIVEVPFSVYGKDRVSWASPVPGFGLTDNVFEVIRKAPYININMSLRDFVFDTSPFLLEEEDEVVIRDRLKAWIWFATQEGCEFTGVTGVKEISESF